MITRKTIFFVVLLGTLMLAYGCIPSPEETPIPDTTAPEGVILIDGSEFEANSTQSINIQEITVTFDEIVNLTDVIQLKDPQGRVAVEYDDNATTSKPVTIPKGEEIVIQLPILPPLDNNTTYTLHLENLSDEAGNLPAQPTITFTTEKFDDETPAEIKSLFLGDSKIEDGVEDIHINIPTIKIVFEKVVRAVGLVQVTDPNNTSIKGNYRVDDDDNVTFGFSEPLAYGTVYNVSLEDVRDINGNTNELAQFRFTTEAAPASSAPLDVILVDESGGNIDTNVSIDLETVDFYFDQTIGSIGFSQIVDEDANLIDDNVTFAGNIISVRPSDPLEGGITYTVTLNFLKDSDGNQLPGRSFSFTTEITEIPDTPDTTPPSLTEIDQTADVSIFSPEITFKFNETIKSVGGVTVTNPLNTITAIASVDLQNPVNVIVNFNANLEYWTTYTVTLTNVKDTADNIPLTSPSGTFTTQQLAVDPASIQAVVTTGDAGKYNQLIIDPQNDDVYIAYIVDGGTGDTLNLIHQLAETPENEADIITIDSTNTSFGPVAMIVSDNATNSVLDFVYFEESVGLQHKRFQVQNRGDNSTWTTEVIPGSPTSLTVPSTIGLVSDHATNLYLSFFDESAGALRYSSCNATTNIWSPITTVDNHNAPSNDIAGQYSSIVLDDLQQPHIAYYYYSGLNPSGDLKYAQYDNTDTTWSLTALATTGEKGKLPVLGQFSGDNATNATDDIFDIVYYNATTDTGGSVKWLNSMKGFTEPNEVTIEHWDNGNSTTIAMKSTLDGFLYAAYNDNLKVNLVVKSNNTWSSPLLIDEIPNQAVQDPDGYFVSLGVDSSGKAHISYYDPIDRNLKYAKTLVP